MIVVLRKIQINIGFTRNNETKKIVLKTRIRIYLLGCGGLIFLNFHFDKYSFFEHLKLHFLRMFFPTRNVSKLSKLQT